MDTEPTGRGNKECEVRRVEDEGLAMVEEDK